MSEEGASADFNEDIEISWAKFRHGLLDDLPSPEIVSEDTWGVIRVAFQNGFVRGVSYLLEKMRGSDPGEDDK